MRAPPTGPPDRVAALPPYTVKTEDDTVTPTSTVWVADTVADATAVGQVT